MGFGVGRRLVVETVHRLFIEIWIRSRRRIVNNWWGVNIVWRGRGVLLLLLNVNWRLNIGWGRLSVNWRGVLNGVIDNFFIDVLNILIFKARLEFGDQHWSVEMFSPDRRWASSLQSILLFLDILWLIIRFSSNLLLLWRIVNRLSRNLLVI